jgi:hypothetical protein
LAFAANVLEADMKPKEFRTVNGERQAIKVAQAYSLVKDTHPEIKLLLRRTIWESKYLDMISIQEIMNLIA